MLHNVASYIEDEVFFSLQSIVLAVEESDAVSLRELQVCVRCCGCAFFFFFVTRPQCVPVPPSDPGPWPQGDVWGKLSTPQNDMLQELIVSIVE